MNRISAAALTICVLLSGGCVANQQIRGQGAPDLDRKLSTFAWIERGDLLTLIVSTRAARYRDGAGYMPLEISLANTGMRRLSLTRESFTLIDEEGNRYPCAGPSELMREYNFLDLDRSQALADLGGLIFDRFASYNRYPSNFSPTRSASTSVVRDRLVLPKSGYLLDHIYFPEPSTGIKGHRFDLFLNSPELEDPVFVKFEVR
jgi:hypothetical protein